jgi:hypothetical protein
VFYSKLFAINELLKRTKKLRFVCKKSRRICKLLDSALKYHRKGWGLYLPKLVVRMRVRNHQDGDPRNPKSEISGAPPPRDPKPESVNLTLCWRGTSTTLFLSAGRRQYVRPQFTDSGLNSKRRPSHKRRPAYLDSRGMASRRVIHRADGYWTAPPAEPCNH